MTNLANLEEILKYAEESDPFRVNNSDKNYRRITAEEALAQRDGNAKVNLWVSKSGAGKNDRRGSTDSAYFGRRGSDNANTGRRGSCDGRRGSNSAANGRRDSTDSRRGSVGSALFSSRYHARMDAALLSDEDQDDDNDNGNSTHSCSTSGSSSG